MKKRIAILVLAGLTLSAFLGTACAGDKITVAGQTAATNGIVVSGEGKVSGQPDIAALSLGVSTLKPTVKEARDDAAATMQKIIDSLKNDGVAEKDIQSSQYSIQPEYDYNILPPATSPRLQGYRVTNTVTIKVRDINKTSQVLDAAVAAGGDLTQVQGISFTIDKPETLRDQARVAAITDAKARAQLLADTAGVKLGNPISIQENSGVQPVPMYAIGSGAAQDKSTTTPIQPGELDIDITVQVIYAIE